MSERGNCFPFLRKVNGHASGEERNFASPASGYALLKERRKNGPRASVRFSRYRYIGLNPFPALHRFESVSNSILDFFDENLKFFFSFFFFLRRAWRAASPILSVLKLHWSQQWSRRNFFPYEEKILFFEERRIWKELKFSKFSKLFLSIRSGYKIDIR